MESVYRESVTLRTTSFYGDRVWCEIDNTPVRLRSHQLQNSMEQNKEKAEQLKEAGTSMQSEVEESLLGRLVVSRATQGISLRLASQGHRHPLLLAAALVVSISLFISITWSITRKDPQTGFTIGGRPLAAGSIIIAVLKQKRNARKVALG
jgi:hypothetical protein